jgi:hypothetical protein
VATSAIVHAAPAWPYFAFFGVLLLGAALYFTDHKRPRSGRRNEGVATRDEGSCS